MGISLRETVSTDKKSNMTPQEFIQKRIKEIGIVRVSYKVGMNYYKPWYIRFPSNGKAITNNIDLRSYEPFVSWEIFMITAKQQVYNHMKELQKECGEMMENLK